jgi:predicted dehydrogenase
MAGIRQLLAAQPGNEIARLSAFTTQLRDYLPPVDTADVIFKTKSGITGTFQLSVGTSLRADAWTVACENGWVKVEGSEVTVVRDNTETKISIPNERTGVPPEVRAWGDALAKKSVRQEQEPEAALADLELVSSGHSNLSATPLTKHARSNSS